MSVKSSKAVLFREKVRKKKLVKPLYLFLLICPCILSLLHILPVSFVLIGSGLDSTNGSALDPPTTIRFFSPLLFCLSLLFFFFVFGFSSLKKIAQYFQCLLAILKTSKILFYCHALQI